MQIMGAESAVYLAKTQARTVGETLAYLDRAKLIFPYDRNVRSAKAYYFTSMRFYDMRKEAIAAIEEQLKVNPFAADLWTALAAYKLADGDEAGAEDAIKQVQKLRVGVKLEKGP